MEIPEVNPYQRVRPTRYVPCFTTKTCETSSYKSATANFLYKAGPFEGNGPGNAQFCSVRAFFRLRLRAQSFLHTAFFAGLKIAGVPLNFPNNVLLLDLPFKAAQGVFKRFTLL